jgi:peptide-methionine (S)-S-oxide reductase
LFYYLLYLLNKKNKLNNKVYLAGGCFWCTESIFLRIIGVKNVLPGYMGGSIKNPAYSEVCGGNTGHTEAIEVIFDPAIISFKDLLEIFFYGHDPTTLNRQGNDVGTQYRSAIFYTSAIQKEEAEEMIQDLNTKNEFSAPIVTEISEEVSFYPAEKEHSNYFNLNKEQSYCQFVIFPKIKKVTAKFNKHISKDE